MVSKTKVERLLEIRVSKLHTDGEMVGSKDGNGVGSSVGSLVGLRVGRFVGKRWMQSIERMFCVRIFNSMDLTEKMTPRVLLTVGFFVGCFVGLT